MENSQAGDSSIDQSESNRDTSLIDGGDDTEKPMGEIDNIDIDIDKDKNGDNKILDDLKNDKELTAKKVDQQ